VSDWLLASEPLVRLASFAAVLAGMALWEGLAPRRERALTRAARWPHNLALAVLNTVLVRLLFPSAAVGTALLAEARGWGLLPWLGVPAWLAPLAAVVALDFAIYLQHRVFHAVPLLWRVHRVHHADLDLDVTSGARFHPIEILLSMAIKLALVVALGAPAVAVLLFEVLLNATAMFNHANARLPAGLDRALRLVVVTPDMHRVHHSVRREEADSNFGFNLPWWDRLLGTYRAEPAGGHRGMTLGLAALRDPTGCSRLDRLLALPWVRLDEGAGPPATRACARPADGGG